MSMLRVELCRFLKIRNCESKYYWSFSEMWNCESKIDSIINSFADSFGHDSRKNAKNCQGIRIVNLFKFYLTQLYIVT